MRTQSCVFLPAAGREHNFSLNFHRTWASWISQSLYIYRFHTISHITSPHGLMPHVEVIDGSPLLGPLPSLPVMSSRRSSWMQQKSEAAAALALVLGAAASISAASKLEATADAALSVRSGMPLFIFSLPLLSSPRTVFQFQREGERLQ